MIIKSNILMGPVSIRGKLTDTIYSQSSTKCGYILTGICRQCFKRDYTFAWQSLFGTSLQRSCMSGVRAPMFGIVRLVTQSCPLLLSSLLQTIYSGGYISLQGDLIQIRSFGKGILTINLRQHPISLLN